MKLPARVAPIVLLAGILALGSWPARADDEPPSWRLDIGLSYLSTTGNTDTSSAGLNLAWERLSNDWHWEAAASAFQASKNGETTAENENASGRLSRELSKRFSVTAGILGERNQFAGIDLRTTLDLGLRVRTIDRPRWKLVTTSSFTWANEDRTGTGGSRNFAGLLLGAKSDVELSDHATTTEEIQVMPNLEDSNDYRIDARASVESALTSILALKFAYHLIYDNVPVPGFRKTDTEATASIVVKIDRGKFGKS